MRSKSSVRRGLALIALLIGAGKGAALADERVPLTDPPAPSRSEPLTGALTGARAEAWAAEAAEPLVMPASMLQPVPTVLPRVDVSPTAPTLSGQASLRTAVGGLGSTSARVTNSAGSFGTSDSILGAEGTAKVSTDLGSLLKKSTSALSTQVQARTPVVHDPRVRSSRVGALAASGSHWVPARIDLDTVLSKFDSRQVAETIVIPGPYTAMYGPTLSTIDVRLLESPRYRDGLELHGATAVTSKPMDNNR